MLLSIALYFSYALFGKSGVGQYDLCSSGSLHS